MNRIFEGAAKVRSMIEARGLRVGDLDTSTNRFGGHSAYFEVEGGVRVRISDHDCNTDFRIDEISLFADMSEADVDAFVARRRENIVRGRELSAIRAAEAAEAARARMAAYEAAQARTAANDAMLAAAGLGHLVGTARKKALKKLRHGAPA